MEDLDRGREPSCDRRHVVSDAERVGRVEADAEVLADLLDQLLDLRRRQVAVVLEREPEAVVAGGRARLA